jgi:teichuronic acid biosynthesis glycosyltransferase TuaC
MARLQIPAVKIQFVSNLFPDAAQPQRGLDNATLLHELALSHEVGAIALRPSLRRHDYAPRPQDESLRPIFLNAPYVPKLGGLFNHRLMARALRPHLDAQKFDVVLASWLFPDGCAVARLAAKRRFPFVLIAQGSDVHQYLRSPLRRQAILRAVGAAAAVITRSADLRRRLVEAGCDGGKIHAVYNGVDTQIFQPGDKAEARRELGMPLDVKVVLFAGNLYAIKNPALLVEAHKRLPAGTVLLIAGTGPLEEKLRAAAGPAVVFAGRQLPEKIAKFMKAADVLCLPSWNEGVPNVILEAFASGLPVVASNVGGIHEVLDQPALGTLVPAGDCDALTKALTSWLTTKPDSAAIRRHGLQFTWAATARRYTEILQAAVA